MLRIGDFSKLAQVSARTLRYYDELGLLKPQMIDRTTSYRYYAVDQLASLNRILALKDLGVELEQIAHLISTNISSDALREALLRQERDLQDQIAADQERLQRVRARLIQIDQEGNPPTIDVTLKSADVQAIAGNRMIVPTIGDIAFFARHMYAELYRWLRQHHVSYTDTQLMLYHADEYIERDYDMECAVFLPTMPTAVPLPPHAAIRLYELPAAALLATTLHKGVLRDGDRTVRELFQWCSQNGYVFQTGYGMLREIHHFEPTDNGLPIPVDGLIEYQLAVVKHTGSPAT